MNNYPVGCHSGHIDPPRKPLEYTVEAVYRLTIVCDQESDAIEAIDDRIKYHPDVECVRTSVVKTRDAE